MIKPNNRASPEGKHTTALTGEKMQSPLWCLTAPPFPRKRGHYKAPLCYELLMKGLLFKALLSHRSAGGEGGGASHQRGESHRRWLITIVLIITYDTESKSRNADFISIAYGNPQPSARRAVKLKNPPAKGRSILRTFLPAP